jgi:hypothetical protein
MIDLIDRAEALAAIERRASDELADANHNYLMGFQDAAEAVRSIPAAMRWIPVSERLPDKPGKYMVTVSNGNVYAGTFDAYSGRFQCAATAWMPLPAPYKEVDA